MHPVQSHQHQLDQIKARKEIADFEGGGIRRVGTMRAIELYAGTKLLANRTGCGFGGIGGTHGVAPLRDGAFALENHYHGFSGAHKFRQLAEKWAGAMNGVEALRFGFSEPQRLDGDNLKLRRVNAARISPVSARPTASGLMIARVRSIAIRYFPEIDFKYSRKRKSELL